MCFGDGSSVSGRHEVKYPGHLHKQIAQGHHGNQQVKVSCALLLLKQSPLEAYGKANENMGYSK